MRYLQFKTEILSRIAEDRYFKPLTVKLPQTWAGTVLGNFFFLRTVAFFTAYGNVKYGCFKIR